MLRYWVARRTDDAPCYSVIDRTKKGCQAQLDEIPDWQTSFDPPELRIVYYRDAFDLLEKLTAEDGGRGYGFDKELK